MPRLFPALLLPLAAAAALALPASGARAQAAGLVLEVEGPAPSGLEPFREIAAGSVHALGAAQVTFAHYRTCRNVTVKGGSLTVEATGYGVEGGVLVGQERADCPREVRLSGHGAQVAGIVLRSAGGQRRWPTRPGFVLVGEGADSMHEAVFLQSDREVARFPLQTRRFTWPADEPPLQPGSAHVLRLGPAGGPATAEVPFTTGSARPDAKMPLTLIRIGRAAP